MLYIIKGTPYVKVSNYYKEVSVEKKGKEFLVKPIGGEETRLTNIDAKDITEMSVSDYYNSKNKNIANKSDTNIRDFSE